MRPIAYLLPALAFCATTAWSETTDQATDPARTAEATKLVDMMNTPERYKHDSDAAFDAMLANARKSMPAEKVADFDAGCTEVKDLMHEKLTLDMIKPVLTQVYAKAFTVDELKELETFFKTKLGSHYLEELGNLSAASAKVAQEALMKIGPDVQRIMTKHLSGGAPGGGGAHVAKGTPEVGKPFPNISSTTLDGKKFDLAAWKGKVVLVDFWATWCGPCVGEMPNVKKDYETYHSKGFEIVGISLDQEKDKLTAFISSKEIPWPQLFDGKGWQNEIAVKFGIQSIPAPFLIGRDGNLVATDLRGEELSAAIAKELDKKAGGTPAF